MSLRPVRLAAALLLAASAGGTSPAPPQGPGLAAGPTTHEERLRLVQERRRRLEGELARLRGREHGLLAELERLEVEVRLRGEELREAEMAVEEAERQLVETTRRLAALEESLARARPLLAARARSLYKLGEMSYVRMLLSVESPSDFLRGYRLVSTLARRDQDRLARFRADLAAEAAARVELTRRAEEGRNLRASLVRTRRALDADVRRKEARLAEVAQQREVHDAYVRELAEAEGRLADLLAGADLATGDAVVPMAAFRGALPWPAAGTVRTPFGRRKHPRFDTYTVQNGVDIEAPLGAPVRAVHEGTVVFADRFLGYGLMVALDHGAKHHTLYAHLGEMLVEKGMRVSTGSPLGRVGASGPDGAGLYFEVRFQGRPEDPVLWLQGPEP